MVVILTEHQRMGVVDVVQDLLSSKLGHSGVTNEVVAILLDMFGYALILEERC